MKLYRKAQVKHPIQTVVLESSAKHIQMTFFFFSYNAIEGASTKIERNVMIHLLERNDEIVRVRILLKYYGMDLWYK